MNALKRRLVALEGPNGTLEYRRWTDERLTAELSKGLVALRLAGLLTAAKWDAIARGESAEEGLLVDYMAEISGLIRAEEVAR